MWVTESPQPTPEISRKQSIMRFYRLKSGWLKEGRKINHGLCEQSKINTRLGFGFPCQDFQQKALVIARDSLFLAIVLLSKNIYSFGMNCFPRDLHHRNCRRTEKGELLVGQPYNSAEDWFPLTKTVRFLTQLRGRDALLPETSQ